jgi:hypothetical protein
MRSRLLLVLLALVLTATGLQARNRGRSYYRDSYNNRGYSSYGNYDRYPRAYGYNNRYRALPPGLAKKYYRRGNLPPAWQRQYGRQYDPYWRSRRANPFYSPYW